MNPEPMELETRPVESPETALTAPESPETTAVAISPFDQDPVAFSEALDRRDRNSVV